jgi:hypothetical protein
MAEAFDIGGKFRRSDNGSSRLMERSLNEPPARSAEGPENQASIE